MRRDQIPLPEEEPRAPWLVGALRIVSRIVSGVIFLGGIVWAARYFTGGELMLSLFIMVLPMAMIWYPKEIDEFGKGGYGEGGASQIILAVFGWVCLLLFLVIVGLKVEGYW